jgi:hypothetical protein
MLVRWILWVAEENIGRLLDGDVAPFLFPSSAWSAEGLW